MHLVPIKVKIGLKSDGHAGYPNFNLLDSSIRDNMDWSKYVDVKGLGWHYDQVSGHKEDTLNSPYGTQYGVLIVPKVFADTAISKFPKEVTKLTELELEDFYDNRSHVYDPDEKIDNLVLEGIKLKQDLGIPLTANQTKALDPNDLTPGVCKNDSKTWKDYKVKTNTTIIQ